MTKRHIAVLLLMVSSASLLSSCTEETKEETFYTKNQCPFQDSRKNTSCDTTPSFPGKIDVFSPTSVCLGMAKQRESDTYTRDVGSVIGVYDSTTNRCYYKYTRIDTTGNVSEIRKIPFPEERSRANDVNLNKYTDYSERLDIERVFGTGSAEK